MSTSATQPAHYTDGVVRQFAIMTVVWGVVGMLVGVFIAAELAWPELNMGIPWLSYGRLRPLHTNAVIFAFGGCALFASSYYAVQRTSQVKLFAPGLASFTFGAGNWSSCWRPSACPWATPVARSTPSWSGPSTS